MKKLINLTKKFKIPLIIVLAAAGVAVTYLFVRAVYVSDSFNDSSMISSVWRVSTSTAGQVQLAEKTCDDSVWYCSLNDVIVNNLGDGDFVVVARADEASRMVWKTSNTACDRPQCGIDGGQSDNLVADNTINFNTYTAREACKQKGGRLATISELQSIYTNRAQFGSFAADNYWSSTEYSATLAYNVNFSTGATNYYGKASSYYVRCVSGW